MNLRTRSIRKGRTKEGRSIVRKKEKRRNNQLKVGL